MEKKNLNLEEQIGKIQKKVNDLEGKMNKIHFVCEDPARAACIFFKALKELEFLLPEIDSDEERELVNKKIEKKRWEYETVIYRAARMLTFEEIKEALENPYMDFECFVLEDILHEKINDMQNGKK